MPAPPPLTDEWTKAFKRAFGSVPPHLAAMTRCPWVAEFIIRSEATQLVHIPYALADLIHLVVSQDNSCRHCYGATRTMLRLSGISESRIRQLESELHRADFPERDRRALEYARTLSRANPRAGKDERMKLRDVGFSDETIAEIATCAACCVISNRIATLTAAAPSPFENVLDRWYAPLIGIGFRISMMKRKKGKPERLPTEATSGPLGSLFTSLDGLPIARHLFQSLSAALASEILPLRAKLLVMAVIGRSLQCPICEIAVAPLLQMHGCSQELLDDVLKRLASSDLDALEAKLVPCARDTVRYSQPALVQEKMRELSASLSPAQFIEFIGVTALANAIARLTVVMGPM